MAGTLVSYLPFTRSVTEDLSGKEWTVTGNPQIINRPDFSVPVAKFEAHEYLSLNNLTVGGNNHWLMDFWVYIPQTSSYHNIIWIGGDGWFFTLLRVLDSGKLRFFQCSSNNLDSTTGNYVDTSNAYFNKWINIKFNYSLCDKTSSYSMMKLSISDGTKWIMNDEYVHLRQSYITKTATLQIGPNILLSQFRFYTRSNTYYLYDFIPNPPTDSGNSNIYLPTRQSFAWNELQVHDTVNFDYSDNINYTTTDSMQWHYKNIGTADGLLVSGTSLTNVSPLKSVTSKAFYQTNRQKCFDTQASKEIYMLFDVYFDGTNRWRAYEESSTNGITGITAQTSGKLNIFNNGTSVGASIPLTINKLETYLLHMKSDATNGYIEVYKDGEYKYTYIGNVNNGDDFSNLELQSDGSGTVFSNIVISNQPIDDSDRWTGNYNNIQRTLTNETWVPEKCLKALLPQIQSMDLCGNTWTVTGTTPTIVTTNYLNGKATQFGKGYIYTNPPALRSNNFTIDFWEYIPSTVNGLTAEMVVIDGTDGTGTQCLSIGYDNGATVPSLWLGKGTSSGWIYSNKIIGTKIRGQWVHRAVVRYHNKIYAFENGKLYTSFAIEDDMYIDITGSSLFIGGFKRASRLHPGMLSEVRVYVGTALWTENFTPPNQEDYFDIYWHFNKPAPILNTNYNTLRYLTNNSKVWKYINPGYTDISPFTYTNSSVTPVQAYDDYTDMQVSGNVNLNIDIYNELCIKFNISIGNTLGTVFSFPYGKGTISISISKPESSTTYLAKIIHERNEENPIGTQFSPETSYSDYELGNVNEEISFIIYIKSDASNKGEIMINSSAWVDADDNSRAAIFPSTGRFHLYNANINEGNTLSKTLSVTCIYNLIVSNKPLTFDDMVCQNINSTQRIVSNDEDWRREKYYWHTYLPFIDSVTKDFGGETWTLHNTLVIQDNACYFDGSGYLWKKSTLDTSKPFTISFYMSAISNNTGGEPCIFQFFIETKSFGLLQDRRIIECKITSSGNLVFSGEFRLDHKTFALSTSFSILDGKMHYVECTYTGSKCLFFVDGMLIGTVSHVFKSSEYGLQLGINANTSKNFTGYLKDFRIYQDYVLHAENFTPSPIMGNRLFYDKSEETMKFESFADVQKETWKITEITSKKILVSYFPFDDDIKDLCNDERFIKSLKTPVFSSQDSTKNKSLSITSSHYYNNIYYNIYDKSLKFIAELDIIANLPGNNFESTMQNINILRIESHQNNLPDDIPKTVASISYWNPEDSLVNPATSNVAKLMISNWSSSNPPDTFIDDYTLTAQSKKSFHVTIIFGDDMFAPYITIFIKSLDGGNLYIYNLIDNKISCHDFYEIMFGPYTEAHGLNINIDEFKFYLDYTDNTPTTIIDKNIEVRFNNGEESVYFEFYADINIIKPLFLNIAIPNCDFWVNVSPSDGIKTIGVRRPVQIESKFHDGPNISSDNTLFNDASVDGYVAKINFIRRASSFIDKMTFIAWVANMLTGSNSRDIEFTNNPTVLVYFTTGAVTLQIDGDVLFTTTMIINYIYHLAVVIDCGALKFYLNGQLMYSNSTILPDVIQEDMEDYWSADNDVVFAGLGYYYTNIFDTPNEINLGQIGEPPSYKIPLYPFKQAGPNLIAYHNDTPYYNKLVSPTDEKASNIRVYHNDTVYALSK